MQRPVPLFGAITKKILITRVRVIKTAPRFRSKPWTRMKTMTMTKQHAVGAK